MKIILVVICLLLSGCATQDKYMDQFRHNMQAMENNRKAQIDWEDREFNRCLKNNACRGGLGMENKIKKIIVEQLGCNFDKVVPEANLFDDLGADSMDMVELIMCLEEELAIEIPDQDVEKLTTVGEVIAYCEAKGK